jgi:hypothetical protein
MLYTWQEYCCVVVPDSDVCSVRWVRLHGVVASSLSVKLHNKYNLRSQNNCYCQPAVHTTLYGHSNSVLLLR